MIVRCTSRRFDFLMKRIGPGHHAPERWEGLSNMKYYYACPDIPVDHDEVKRDRLRYWDCEQHIYKEDRLVFLDTKKPGDKTVPPEKIDLVRGRYQDWTVFPGQLKAFEPSMLEEEVEVVGRKLRVQENKALKESLARQKLLEESIDKITNGKKNVATSVVGTVPKKGRKNSPPKVKPSTVSSRSAPPRISSSADGNLSAANNKLISTLMAEIADLKKQNQSQSSSRKPNASLSSTSSNVFSDEINEADQKLILEQKKRKIANEELEAAQARTAKNKLEVEARLHEDQIKREGEVQRIKLKAQADDIQDQSERRRIARDEEDRRRRFNQEDQNRRQEMQFAKEEHAVMIQKEKANITMSASTQQHEQQLQLIYASQQPSNLAMVLNKMKGTKQPTYNVVKPIQQHRTAAFEGFHNVSSSKVGQKRKTRDVEDGAAGKRTQDDDEAQVVHNLRQQLQRERDIQENIRRGNDDADEEAADADEGADEDEGTY